MAFRIGSLVLLIIFFAACKSDEKSDEIIPHSTQRDIIEIRSRLNEKPDNESSLDFHYKILDSIYQLPESRKDLSALANYYSSKGFNFIQSARYTEAKTAIRKCINICNKQIALNNPQKQQFVFHRANSYSDLAIISYHLSLNNIAIVYLKKAITDYKTIENKGFLLEKFYIISQILLEANQIKTSKQIILKSIKHNTNPVNSTYLTINHIQLANILMAEGKIDSAKTSLFKAKKVLDKSIIKHQVLLNISLANLYIYQEKTDSVSLYLQKAILFKDR